MHDSDQVNHNQFKPLLVAIATLLLIACDAWEHSSITVTYSQGAQSELRMEMLERVRIENALKAFADANGYKCRPGFKDAEEITCRGPQNLHLKYEPGLNKSEFLVTFSWLNSGNRNHDEFVSNVAKFTTYMRAIAGEENVRIVKT